VLQLNLNLQKMDSVINEILGPQVAIVDNNYEEVKSIETRLDELNIGNVFFPVDFVKPIYPKKTISTIELVFLDLFYNTGINAAFDPFACCEWLTRIVPANKNYILIIWSNDPDHKDELMEVIELTDAPMPFFVELSPKAKYQSGNFQYDVTRLLNDLNRDLAQRVEITSTEYLGQIIAVEKNSVLINCRIFDSPETFEVRRFDLKPFAGAFTLEKGAFVRITVTNKPGVKTFEFIQETSDKSQFFQKPDDFKDLDISFLEEDDDEHENHL
jgi:hypothetical protein